MADFKLEHIQKFRFKQFFVDDLGWDRPVQQQPYTLAVGEEVFTLDVVAHKRGVQVLHCRPDAQGRVPTYATRQKIERKVTAEAREHLIVFTDAAQTTQVWQWVARIPAKPVQYREVHFRPGDSAELLKQKLSRLRFTLDEEELLTVLGVAQRLEDAIPRDKVTKKFYTEFKKQRDAFEAFIAGIPKLNDDLHWYAAVLIDRLMFIWFLQEKEFLDGKKRYLQERLAAHMAAAPTLSFYKAFLCPLFFRGFATERTDANRRQIDAEFGRVPYLNGGLFSQHELEQRYGDALDVSDVALEKLFTFFDAWEWHLDDRPLRNDREINPDVLGYIFEKFVNQKQMGAYYTKEDLTEYIGKNTIIPALLHKVRAKHPGAFDALAWPLLQADPNRYIYPAMRQGADNTPYPTEIELGRDTQAPDLLARRKAWNNKTPDAWALPTEIWRETIARHDRTREIRAKLAAGEIRDTSDLITYNLDVRRFAQDVIEHCTDAALLREFWAALAGQVPRKAGEKFRPALSVLDPTCGSGAFLFAALNILKPLYDAALGTMAGLLLDADQAGGKQSPEKWKDIEEAVERFAALRSDRARDYAVIKHIVMHNLYGVDIEEQATEIAKLRLFLKLVSLLEPGDSIEPLPDIDFNIRHGNTLVGYATADETEAAVKGATQGNLFSDAWEDIRIRLIAVEEAYHNFQIQQVQRGGHVTAQDKQALAAQLGELEEMLNFHLCRAYGKDPTKAKQYGDWKASHKPFHWYVDFYPLMAGGGFDAVIGNPPYVVFPSKDVPYVWPDSYYACQETKNLYALVAERSLILSRSGVVGLIVQLTSLSSERMLALQKTWLKRGASFVLPFPRRPESVFEGVEMPTAVWLRLGGIDGGSLATSPVRRFYSTEREHAIDSTRLWKHRAGHAGFRIPKFGGALDESVLSKLTSNATIAILVTRSGSHRVFYQEACRYWAKSSCFAPRFVRNGEAVDQPHGRTLTFSSDQAAGFVNCILNSSLFYWYYSTLADCEHINDGLVREFPLPVRWGDTDWAALSSVVDDALRQTAIAKTINTKQGHVIEYDEINGKQAAAVIAQADAALARTFGFTAEEADHVLSYDSKYRMMLNASATDQDD